MADIRISFPGLCADYVDDSESGDSLAGEQTRHDLAVPSGIIERSAAATSFDLGTLDMGAGGSIAADHLILLHADKLQDAGLDRVQLSHYDTPGGSSTVVFNDTSADVASLYGKENDVYLKEFSSVDRRLFEVLLAGTSQTYKTRVMHVGLWFSPADTISDFEVKEADNRDSWFRADDLTLKGATAGPQRLRYSYTWQAVTDVRLLQLEEKLRNDVNQWCFLYADTETKFLSGESVAYCKVVRFDYTKEYQDWNVLRMEFEEVY